MVNSNNEAIEFNRPWWINPNTFDVHFFLMLSQNFSKIRYTTALELRLSMLSPSWKAYTLLQSPRPRFFLFFTLHTRKLILCRGAVLPNQMTPSHFFISLISSRRPANGPLPISHFLNSEFYLTELKRTLPRRYKASFPHACTPPHLLWQTPFLFQIILTNVSCEYCSVLLL